MPRSLLKMLRVVLVGACIGLTAVAAAAGIQLWGVAAMAVILVGGQAGAFTAVFVHGYRERVRPIGQTEADAWHGAAEEVEECRGWKTATLHFVDGELFFTGVFRGSYGAESVAVCEMGGTHPAPRADCTCGFHVYFDRERARAKQNQCETDLLLEVELYGTVVEHDRGARGEEQTILAVHVRPRCHRCTRRADGMTVDTRYANGRLVPACTRCGREEGLWTLTELAARCGTEVRWDTLRTRKELFKSFLLP